MGHLSSGEAESGGISVRTVTLDGLVGRGEIPPPAIMKCDVEGAELDALRGAETVLRTYHPVIVLDKHTDEGQAACGEFLRGLGYQLKALDGLPLWESSEVLAVWGNSLERTT
jgi:hypothetical protein